jgi:hypothetical protein
MKCFVVTEVLRAPLRVKGRLVYTAVAVSLSEAISLGSYERVGHAGRVDVRSVSGHVATDDELTRLARPFPITLTNSGGAPPAVGDIYAPPGVKYVVTEVFASEKLLPSDLWDMFLPVVAETHFGWLRVSNEGSLLRLVRRDPATDHVVALLHDPSVRLILPSATQ